jgi:hypothetical protein
VDAAIKNAWTTQFKNSKTKQLGEMCKGQQDNETQKSAKEGDLSDASCTDSEHAPLYPFSDQVDAQITQAAVARVPSVEAADDEPNGLADAMDTGDEEEEELSTVDRPNKYKRYLAEQDKDGEREHVSKKAKAKDTSAEVVSDDKMEKTSKQARGNRKKQGSKKPAKAKKAKE